MNNEFENMKSDLEEDWMVNEANLQSKQAVNLAGDGEVIPPANSQNQANSDDWAMNTMVSGNILNAPGQKNPANRTADAPNTNPLDEKKNEWRMPEPVFRVSKGKKIEKSVSPVTQLDFSAKPSEASEPVDSLAEIQPQPYISEALITGDEYTIENPSAKVESKSGRTVFVVAGILAMILFAISFLIGIYFLFFRQPDI